MNVRLAGVKQKFWVRGDRGTILLRTPSKTVTLEEIKEEVPRLFGVEEPVELVFEDGKPVTGKTDVSTLNKKVIVAVPANVKDKAKILGAKTDQEGPFVR